MAAGDQCAIGPDGKLLDAKDIEWRHDPDDLAPLRLPLAPSSAKIAVLNSTVREGKYPIIHAFLHLPIMFNHFF